MQLNNFIYFFIFIWFLQLLPFFDQTWAIPTDIQILKNPSNPKRLQIRSPVHSAPIPSSHNPGRRSSTYGFLDKLPPITRPIWLHHKKPSGLKDLRTLIVIKEIGKGSFGSVLAVREPKPPSKTYAVKTCQGVVNNVITCYNEIQFLNEMSKHLTPLASSFMAFPMAYWGQKFSSNKGQFNILMELQPYGSLDKVVIKYPLGNIHGISYAMSFEELRFIGSELFAGINHIHSTNVLHSDIKPENILVTSSGHLVINDFGVSRMFENVGQRNGGKFGRLSGSHDFLPPEALDSTYSHYDSTVDYWAGVITLLKLRYPLFKTVHGLDEIQKEDTSPGANEFFDFVRVMLQEIPQRRLAFGVDGFSNIQTHPFFRGVDWELVESRKNPIPATFKKILRTIPPLRASTFKPLRTLAQELRQNSLKQQAGHIGKGIAAAGVILGATGLLGIVNAAASN